MGLDLQRFGVHPRDLAGLAGVVAAPLLHADFAHLLSQRAAARDRGHRDAVPLSRCVALRAARDLFRSGRRGVAVRTRLDPHRRERHRVRPRELRVRRRHDPPRPARHRGIAARRVPVRRAGVGRAADQARRVVGDAPRRGRDRRGCSRSRCAARDVPPRKRYSWEDEPEPADEDGDWSAPHPPHDAGPEVRDGDAPAPPLRERA